MGFHMNYSVGKRWKTDANNWLIFSLQTNSTLPNDYCESRPFIVFLYHICNMAMRC